MSDPKNVSLFAYRVAGVRTAQSRPLGQLRVASSDAPVSNKLFKLAKISGHPLETASMSFDPGVLLSWAHRELDHILLLLDFVT